MAYADDIVIIGRSLASMREGFQLLEEASKEVGLVIYEGKTNIWQQLAPRIAANPRATEIGRYTFE
jgi:hypothetical protein